jgi:hypothetical protein
MQHIIFVIIFLYSFFTNNLIFQKRLFRDCKTVKPESAIEGISFKSVSDKEPQKMYDDNECQKS